MLIWMVTQLLLIQKTELSGIKNIKKTQISLHFIIENHVSM